jgi:hypothetical protein
MVLLILGLAISIPLVIFGSTLMIKLMERFPFIVVLGAALIGWVAGETIVGDTTLIGTLEGHPWLHYGAAAMGALFVVLVGRWLARRGQLTAGPKRCERTRHDLQRRPAGPPGIRGPDRRGLRARQQRGRRARGCGARRRRAGRRHGRLQRGRGGQRDGG